MIKPRAAGVLSRPARASCILLGTAALAVGTLHPVDAKAPKLPVAAPCATTDDISFTTPGTEGCFTVPPNVYQVEAGMIAGSGGFGYNPGGGAQPPGGTGATVTSVVYVTPGETLYAEVGSTGMSGGTGKPPETPGAGGVNGGGNGGTSRLAAGQPPAGGGGGASDLRTEPAAGCGSSPGPAASLASRILVAGGGGGGGETNANSDGDGGGRGGSAAETPQAGTDGAFASGLDGRGGGAGSSTAGGAGGAAGSVGGTAGSSGTPGCGGAGGQGTGGGGGGGGYFGGGGGGGGAEGSGGSGAGGGGGGGASYANPLLTCNAKAGIQDLATARFLPVVVIQPVRVGCPTLKFEPDVSSGGFTVTAVGSGWTPEAPITLYWAELGSLPADVAVGTITPTTDSFTYTILLMTHDEVGERALVAAQFPSGPSNVAFMLVVLSPEEPPTFLFRR